jgi:alpha-acetolactate decarboxylase
MSALDLNIGLMVLLEDLAKEHYDGHFTIMKLGPVWRIGFGTPLDSDGMIAWADGKTFAEAAKKAIAGALIEQRMSAALVKEVAETIDSLNSTVHVFPRRRK